MRPCFHRERGRARCRPSTWSRTSSRTASSMSPQRVHELAMTHDHAAAAHPLWAPAGTTCAKAAAVSRPPCVMPTVSQSTLAQPWNGSLGSSTSSAGQTSRQGAEQHILTVTVTVSELVNVPSLTVSVSVYGPGAVNVASVPAAVSVAECHGSRAGARPFISQRRSRTVVRGRACQRHRGGGQRDGRVRASIDCRRCILSRAVPAAGGLLPPPPPPPPHAARVSSAPMERTD